MRERSYPKSIKTLIYDVHMRGDIINGIIVFKQKLFVLLCVKDLCITYLYVPKLDKHRIPLEQMLFSFSPLVIPYFCLMSSLAYNIAIAHKQQLLHIKAIISTMDSLPQQRNKRLLARPFSKSNKSQKSGKGSTKSGKSVSSTASSVGNGGGKSSKGYQLFKSKANKSSKGEIADGTTLTKSGKSDAKSGKGFKVSRIIDRYYNLLVSYV